MKRNPKFAILTLLTLAGNMVLLSQPLAAQQKRAVNPPGSPAGLPFSNGIVVGNTLYVAGTEGTISGDIQKETRSALENIRKVVETAGFGMGDVVAVTVYLADIKEFAAMNEVYKQFFPDPKPVRATVQVAALVSNARIEISAIAVKTR